MTLVFNFALNNYTYLEIILEAHLHPCPWTTKLKYHFFLNWDLYIKKKSGIWGSRKNLNIEKITFKVVQMKVLAMHIANQKLSI